MVGGKSAAIVTVGSELVEGLRVDTNTAHIARAVAGKGFSVCEAESVGDDAIRLSEVLQRLCGRYELVIVTGGLGPTHDDITRQAAARALGSGLETDASIAELLAEVVARHSDPGSKTAVLTQALVLERAEVLLPVSGTAPGQIVSTPVGLLALLPGPPTEMGEMLDRMLNRFESVTADPIELGVVGLTESDVQHAAQRGLAPFDRIVLTVLAKPGDVRVVLLDAGAGAVTLRAAADAVCSQLGSACYSASGETLAQATVAALLSVGQTCSVAESCTGGLVSSALTDVPGASEVFPGGVIAYSDEVKVSALGVPLALLDRYGAVSEQAALAMADGVRSRVGSHIAVSVTGVAGPGGGSAEKPVGLVWFGLSSDATTIAVERRFARGSRESVRARACATALDLIRRRALGI